MALLPFTSNNPFEITLLFIFTICLVPSSSSLATFSVSETANRTLVCGLIPSSPSGAVSLNCSSSSSTPQFILPVNPDAAFTSIVSGDGFLCGLRTFSAPSSSVMHCWRFAADGGGAIDYKRIYRGPALQQLEAGNSHICGLVNGRNELLWWQWPGFNSTSIQNVSSIAVGEDFVCGLTRNGAITCFGSGDSPKSVTQNTQGGNFSVVAAGFRHVCAITVDRDLHCWGDWTGEVPQGKFTALALGENRSCGLRSNNRTVACWGQNGFALPNSLQGFSFVSIEAKRRVFCGVLTSNFSLLCWGNNIFSSNFLVFDKVLPGPCTNTCPCGSMLPSSGALCGDGQFICQSCFDAHSRPTQWPQPQPQPESGNGGWSATMVALIGVGCSGSSVVALASAFFLYKRCKCRGCRVHDSGPLDEAAPAGQQGRTPQAHPEQPPAPQRHVLEKKLGRLAGNAGHLEEFSLEILLEATNNFSEDHKIGTGSFGSVYKATLDDGRQVAVKRAEISSTSSYAIGTKRQEQKDLAFISELESLSRLHHKNLVRLLGFCEDHCELLLIYDYLENGTLHDHLHNSPSESPLTTSWPARIKAALDAARGIEYLHEYAVPSIIHRDIKSSNILLDSTWTAKVSDFGLSLMGPEEGATHLSLRAAGTVGYMDPEYYRLQQLTKKSDVYSFGVVLLELLSGCRAIHRNDSGTRRNVVDYVVPYIVRDELHRVLDPNVPPPTPLEIEAVAYVGYLAADCVTLEGRNRPSMTETVNSLERALAACTVSPTVSRSTTASSTEQPSAQNS